LAGGATFGGRTPSRLPAVRAGIARLRLWSRGRHGRRDGAPRRAHRIPRPRAALQRSAAPSAGPNQQGNPKPNPFGGRPFNGKDCSAGWVPSRDPAVRVRDRPSTVPGFGPGAGNGDFGGIGFGRITVTAISQRADARDGRRLDPDDHRELGHEDHEGWRPATVDDVHIGDGPVHRAQERRRDWTITNLAVVLPQTAGTVTAIGSDTITITGRDGTSQTIHMTGATTYHRGSSSASRSDVTVGSTIVATGERGSDGSLTATTVTIVPARVVGTVSAVNGDTLTISRRTGRP
jgi:hypothetical protein